MAHIAEIERKLDHDRDALSDTLDRLRGNVAPERILRDGIDLVQHRGGALLQAGGEAVRANPLGFATVGLGVAMIAWGFYRQNANQRPAADDLAAVRPEPLSRWEDEGGAMPVGPQLATDADADHGAEFGNDDWMPRLRQVQKGARARLRELEHSARAEASHLRDVAEEKAALASDYLKDSRDALAHGLHDLSEIARERILEARRRAFDAAERAEAAARDGLRQGSRAAGEHPVVAAVIAAGIGAAAAALLPRSRMEDEAFGNESDRLMAEASRLLREERARLGRAAEAAGSELGAQLGEAAQDVLHRAAERAQDEIARRTDAPRPNGSAH